MIQITPQMHVLVAVEPVDLRKGIDGLAAVCREKLQADPFSGWLFIFRSRRASAIRLLVYDGQGFWTDRRDQWRYIISGRAEHMNNHSFVRCAFRLAPAVLGMACAVGACGASGIAGRTA